MKKKYVTTHPKRMARIISEFRSGFLLLKSVDKAVSIFGSKKTAPGDPYYEAARKLSFKLAQDGFAVITGGGPGIMEAANRGAYEAGGDSIGLSIDISDEEGHNPYVKRGEKFYYFFTRKVMLSAPAQAYVFFPGGYGTFDEFFELITLIQTKKTRVIPVVLYSREFWSPLFTYMKDHLYKKWHVIDEGDLKYLNIVDTVDAAYKVISRSKSRHALD